MINKLTYGNMKTINKNKVIALIIGICLTLGFITFSEKYTNIDDQVTDQVNTEQVNHVNVDNEFVIREGKKLHLPKSNGIIEWTILGVFFTYASAMCYIFFVTPKKPVRWVFGIEVDSIVLAFILTVFFVFLILILVYLFIAGKSVSNYGYLNCYERLSVL